VNTSALPPSPYKGLVPFTETEADARFFFGRDRERRIITANLRTSRLTLLYGPSGVGKSSLINAGVVYHLRQRAITKTAREGQLVAALAGGGEPSPRAPAPRAVAVGHRKEPVVVVFTAWDGDLLKSLKGAIFAGLKASGYAVLEEDEASLRELSLTEMLEGLLSLASRVELLIILDGFEEYFVYHADDAAGALFADEFSHAVVNLRSRANFLISIREDWLARLDRFKGHIPSLFENSIRIDHLDEDAARQAIVKPIERYNELARESGDERQAVLDKDFVELALDQLSRLVEPDDAGLAETSQNPDEKPRAPRIQAAALQIVLQHLWEKVKDDPQPALGPELLPKPDTARGIYESHLDKALNHLRRGEKKLAANFFRFLVAPSGTKYAVTAEGLADSSGRAPEEIRRVLEKLSEPDVRILNRVAPSPTQSKQPRYELTSDVLAAPILRWAKEVRDKRRRAQTLWLTVAGALISMAILVLGGALVRSREWQRILDERRSEAEEKGAKIRSLFNTVQRQDEHVPHSKAVLRGHTDNVTSAIFMADDRVLTASGDGSAILWDVTKKEPVYEFIKESKGLVFAIPSPKGDVVVTASTDGSVTIWDRVAPDGSKWVSTTIRESVGHHATNVAFTPSGNGMAISNTAGEVTVWDCATKARIAWMPGDGQPIRQIAISPHGTYLAAASDDRVVRVWRVGRWGEPSLLQGHREKVNGLSFSPDEEYIATASTDTTVRLWKVATGVEVRVLRGHAAGVNSVTFDREGRHLLTISDDTTGRIWNVESGASIQLTGHTDKVLSAAFSPNGQQVVTASKDNSVRLWSAATGKSLVEFRGHVDSVTYVSFSFDGKYVLSASDDVTARVWYAPEVGPFEVAQPTIDTADLPRNYAGPCPVTIPFLAQLEVKSGSGTVEYRFEDSEGRIWPSRLMTFDTSGLKYVNWYWRISQDYSGSETIRILKPEGVKEGKVKFSVKCNGGRSATPTPTATLTPTPAPSASP
jgi:WD40 repeat protein